MTVVFQGSRTIQAGAHESNVLTVPNTKVFRKAVILKISMEAELFPDGITEITMFISTDGGNTFRSASMTVEMPASFRGSPPHFWELSFNLGVDENPTHAKFATNAPATFTTNVTIEAL